MSLRGRISTSDGKRLYVRWLFGTIADSYDLITVVLSYGLDRRWKRRLVELVVGKRQSHHVADQDPAFLRFIEKHDLKPGQTVQVEARDAVSDAVRLRARNQTTITIGARAASKLLVELDTH